jgi:hypothetical protein
MKDPKHVNLQDLGTLETLKDVKQYTEKNYPEWIIGFAERYSDDYPHLTCTWVELAKMMKAEPAQIMLVRGLPTGTKDNPDKSCTVLTGICDIFSRAGFMIRDGADFQQCTVCDALLPTEMAFRKLAVKPPFKWINTCRICADNGEAASQSKPRIEELSSDDEQKKECMT